MKLKKAKHYWTNKKDQSSVEVDEKTMKLHMNFILLLSNTMSNRNDIAQAKREIIMPQRHLNV